MSQRKWILNRPVSCFSWFESIQKPINLRAHYQVTKPIADDGEPVAIIQPSIVYGPGDRSDLHSMYRD